MKIGICGTGKMGSEIAKRLIESDQDITVWNRTQSKASLLINHGAKIASNISELVKNNCYGSDTTLDCHLLANGWNGIFLVSLSL